MVASPEQEDDELLEELVRILFDGEAPVLSPAVPWNPMGWQVED
jgi:hypothetical protein